MEIQGSGVMEFKLMGLLKNWCSIPYNEIILGIEFIRQDFVDVYDVKAHHLNMNI